MAGFFLRRLIFGLFAMFVVRVAELLLLRLEVLPAARAAASHAYWVWLRGIPTGRSFAHGLLNPHLLPIVGDGVRPARWRCSR